MSSVPGAVRVEPVGAPKALPEQKRALAKPTALDQFKLWIREQGMEHEDVLHVIGGDVLNAATIKDGLDRLGLSGIRQLQEFLLSAWAEVDSEHGID